VTSLFGNCGLTTANFTAISSQRVRAKVVPDIG
jgi:hypothetical protein